MEALKVQKAPLPWWAAGLVLGLVQVLAVSLSGPLGVSTQYVVVDAKIMNEIAPEYTQAHPLISSDKYQKFDKGWWLDVGLVVGALLAALVAGRFKIRTTTVWWQINHGSSVAGRFLAGFLGGILILVGARFAHGCTSGQFASGWAQLSLAAVPFTITLFAFGMITAWLVYPKTPDIEK
ncbi:MAG: YeeE/YedE family protein [Sedimentisphaerales bacterium]|nr:YeeE/YedE family protein [Sedimentisphaerales bacterium]